ncbi:MAG TPA: DUF1592 domain-containing protein [Bryobacteraceae bacterium]|nr:DUF1592 domain-containing protein [Bryobacteraceae bacterium]
MFRLACFVFAAAAWAAEPHETAFVQTVVPFLKTRCAACHNGANKTAGLDVQALQKPEAALREKDRWQDILERVRTGEMPPPGMPKPSAEELTAVLHWMEVQIERQEKSAKPDPGRVTARRLNKVEYTNTIRDLLGISLYAADDFPNDDSGYGFDNNGDVLSLSPVLMEKYLTAAERISQTVIPPPTPNKMTLDRVTSDRAKGEPSPGGMAITHRFPFWAEYEIEGRAAIVRGKGRFFIALFLDGKPIQTAEVFPGDGPNRLVNIRMPVEPGDHRIRAVFVNEKNEPISFGDPTQLVADYIGVRGPFPNPSLGAPPAQKRLFLCSEKTAACAEKIVGDLLPRAWRRPVTRTEIQRVARFISMAQENGESFERGVQVALQAVLVSPQFLYRLENDGKEAVHRIGDYELASRLSYFLWSSMPDAELARAAGAGELQTEAGLRKQVQRMLADGRSEALVDSFAGQWLQLRNLESAKPDPGKFPQFDDGLRDAMIQETKRFFAHVVREDRPVTEFLNARYTFVNERLAKHYGLAGVEGPEMRQVPLDTAQRGGLLAQGSVLTISSYPTRTSPVLRGKWILENLLGAPPPPPPPGVPELDDSKVGAATSLREQLEKHRASASCSVCHNKMDPLGFGLENYDAIGNWREKDGAFPIDSAGTLPGGKRFSGPMELRTLLSNEPSVFVKALTEKMLTYALGRGVERYDRNAVLKISNQMAANEYRMSSLILGIVDSLPFQNRRGSHP